MGKLIAFSGTHGTGKSTQAYILAHKLKLIGKSAVVLDELARECPFPINQTAGAKSQFWMIAAQMKRELKLIDKYDYVITDRSLFDPLSYAVTLGLFSKFDFQFFKNYMSEYYFRIFILDPDKFNYFISDGIRDMDPSFRIKVHNCLVGLYDDYKINYEYITDKDEIDENLRFILKM